MLPIIERPRFNVKNSLLPGGEITYYPMTVAHEDILLQTKGSEDEAELVEAVSQVIEGCVKDPSVVPDLPLYAVEWLFLKIAAKSGGEVRDLTFECQVPKDGSECKTKNDIKLNIDTVELVKPEGFQDVFEISEGFGFKLTHLPFKKALDAERANLPPSKLLALHLKQVYQGDKVWERGVDFTDKEAEEFVSRLTSTNTREVAEKFIGNSPSIEHLLKFKCAGCGHEHSIKLSGLSDFFG